MFSDSRRQNLYSVATAAAGLMLAVGALTAGCSSDDEARDASGQSPSAAVSTSPTPTSTADATLLAHVPEGVWAGEHLILTVSAEGAEAEFDCATGVVKQPLSLGDGGHFDVPASYSPESGGPVSTDDARAPPIAARYRGRLIDAQHLTISVVLTKSGQTSGPFELDLGGQASLERCV